MVAHRKAGVHYPRSTGEFQSWFETDADYLAWLRWPEGFVCPQCENLSDWVVAGGASSAPAATGARP
ncbi:transposase [Ferrimicrobium sp.]|uniref:transposase n=1 Tax=Ferrimicrobium sp. TaxID=2926050 RepID=UPI0026027B74|nr:transposase [Ferrimicrobium sp.]